ncbi:MAG TPA: SDR family NAD(P)-dependent oxidoreductase [Tepidisphaeraceae bacterium]|jgi:NAD(P)-dependent dehydrogenase (short-subunit alcohol dehydrogenase family)
MAAGALAGKVIVIVGGTTGLGLSAASACIKEGGKVVVVGRDRNHVAEAQKTLGEGCCAIEGNASEPATADRAITVAVERLGGFHALYHVAGGSGRRMGDGPLHEITDDGWHETLNLNLTSLFNSNRAAVRHFLSQGAGGSILNMSSVLAFSPSPNFFATHAYAAAKSGAIGFTQSCAAYYAGDNIRFNVLAPALVQTPMSQRATTDEAIMKFIKTKQPLDGGRIGRPSDLDAAVVYFLSDQSRFVTGQTLSIDGGWSVTEGKHP